MKKKRTLHLGALASVCLLVLTGCGTSKNLTPVSELVYTGASPPSLNVGVNPPLTHQTYFRFSVKLSENSLSMVPSDAWTVQGYEISYTLLSDPGHHLLGLPPSEHRKANSKVQPGIVDRLPVVIVTDSYLQDNAAGFIGTSDKATVKAHLLFHAFRNRDGMPQEVNGNFIFNIGNY